MPALLISFGAQPLPLSLEASGYYDTDGNWVEDYTYYDPSYSAGGYYDEFGNWISDGSGSGDTGSTGSSYDIWLSPSSEIDTDDDGISDYDEVYGYSIETESYYEVPYSYEEYDSETGEYVSRDSSYTSTTYNSIWVTTNPTDPDTDGDGLPDGWERLFSFHPNDLTDGFEDDDSDGLRNGLEYALGTDLWNDDSDEDGFTDGEEVQILGSNPLNPNDPGTTPLTNAGSGGGSSGSGGPGTGGTGSGSGSGSSGSGSGGSGLAPDWLTWQGEHFSDLLAANPDDPEATGDGDPDNDELTNIEEFLLGTDPRNPDTDGDDLLDGWEVAGLVLHFDRTEIPTSPAAPLPGESGFSGLVYGPYQFQSSSTLYADDALSEIGVVETWTQTVETHDETWGITATTQETMERTGLYNAEGTLVFPDDGWIVNESGGLVPNTPVTTGPTGSPEPSWTQYFNHDLQIWVGTFTSGSTVSTWWWVYTDPLSDDSDGDGMPDGWEYENWFNPKKASDAAEDPDDDTLSNLLEYLNGTNPWLSDTDGDGLSDSHELNVTLTDPLDPADPGEDSGGTAPIGGGITTVTRYQAFGGGGGSTGGNGSGGGGGGGSELTMSGGGLLLGSQQSGLGNSLHPGNGGQKQTGQPTSEDELYLEVRRVYLSYGPAGGGEPLVGGGDGAHDGYWNEVTDPVTNEMVLREWISTGGGTDGTDGTSPDEPTEYAGQSSRRINGQVQYTDSEPTSSASPAISFLENGEMESPVDWDPDVAYPASSGHSATFTSLKKKENPKQENRGSGELVEFRLARKTAPDGTHLAVEREVEKTYLKVFKSRPAPFDEADEWTIEKVEVVNLKVQEGDSKSIEDKENPVPDAVLKPEIVEGKITGVSLFPVEIVDNDYKALEKMRFARMEESLTADGNLEPMHDDDRFYVQVSGPESLGEIKIKLGTVENPEEEKYNDNPTEISLTYKDGVWRTKALVLVSDSIDDSHDGSDDDIDDQTHLGQAGGKVQISSINIEGKESIADLKVPIRKRDELSLNVIAFEGAGLTKAAVEKHIDQFVRERFAQTGLRITHSVTEKPWNSSFGSHATFYLRDQNSDNEFLITSGAENLMNAHGTDTLTDVTVFVTGTLLVKNEDGTPNSIGGVGLHKSIAWPYLKGKYRNNIFLNGGTPATWTLSHEVGHLYTDKVHYGESYSKDADPHLIMHNLMRKDQPILSDTTIEGPKRIYVDQDPYSEL